MTSTPLTESSLPLTLYRRGKVRDVYVVDEETLLLVASDRVSAFDVVLREPIPSKGSVLTQMSAYWFRRLASVAPNHFLTADVDTIIARLSNLEPYRSQLLGRAMLARRTTPIPFEAVVRGYLAGSAWKEYRQQGTLAGEPLTSGLLECAKLDPPIFSPATKAESGHDENITVDRMRTELGAALADQVRDASLALYTAAAAQTEQQGIIIADTKFEFGHTAEGELLVIDELLTPDSSRFWPTEEYQAGRSQPSFDKQPLRDYLDQLRQRGEWDGDSTPPPLSSQTVAETSARYRDAWRRVTGDPLPDGV
jgi:phosphoribosylaminoimidazole-succinocarboxamide synthase